MYARVSTIRGQPSKFKEGTRALEESIPTLRKNPGFQDIYCLTDQKTGNCIVVALWESEQALQNASNAVMPVRNQVSKAFGSTEEPRVDVYEVSYSTTGQMRRAA